MTQLNEVNQWLPVDSSSIDFDLRLKPELGEPTKLQGMSTTDAGFLLVNPLPADDGLQGMAVPGSSLFNPVILGSSHDIEQTVTWGADAVTGQIGSQPLVGDSDSFTTQAGQLGHAIVFIDSTVPDYQSLLAGVDPTAEVIVLDAAQDGVQQITDVLAQRQGISAVHIVSHGSAGSLQLGNVELNAASLGNYSDRLQSWSHALTDNADLLIYGCDVAAGAIGTSFIQQISSLTGADVSASDDLTGASTLGGDWNFEFSEGEIEAQITFTQSALVNYQYTFATTLSELLQQSNAFQDLDKFLNGLQSSLTATDGFLKDINLPIVGNQLSSSADFIGNFRAALIENLDNSFSSENSLALLQAKLFQTLGSQGLDILLDSKTPFNSSNQAVIADNQDDVKVFFVDANYQVISDIEQAHGIQFELNLGQSLAKKSVDLDFSLGLDNLPLKLESKGNINFGLGWGLNLNFGLDVNKGFYLDTSESNELTLAFGADLNGFAAKGDLFILEANVKDQGSQLAGHFNLDLTDPYNQDQRIFANEIFSNAGLKTDFITPSFDGDAKLNLGLGLGIPGTKLLPSFKTDLIVDFGFDYANNKFSYGLDKFSFNNISIDVGSLVNDVLKPFKASLQPFLDVLSPLARIFNTPIPIISDFLGEDITLGNIDKLFSVLDLNLPIVDFVNPYQPLIDTITQLGALTTFLKDGIVTDEKGNILLILGSVSVSGIGSSSGSATTPKFDSTLSDPLTKLLDGGFGDSYFSFPIITDPSQLINLLFGQNADLVRFDSPRLFGDLNLKLELDTEKILNTIQSKVDDELPDWVERFGLDGKFVVNEIINPFLPKIKLAFENVLRFDAQLSLGYDTQGIFNLIKSKNPLDLLDGFYLDDTRNSAFPVSSLNPLKYGTDNYFEKGNFLTPPPNLQDIDVPELYFLGSQSFTGSITQKILPIPLGLGNLEGSFGLGLSGSGRIEGSLDFNEALDKDRDGKLRLDELGSGSIADVIKPCLHFDLAANAFIDIKGRISYENVVTKTVKKLWEWVTQTEVKLESKTFEKKITLFDGSINLDVFNCGHDEDEESSQPLLATFQNDGSLLLNMGKFAKFRRVGNLEDGDEKFTISHISGSAGNEVVEIKFGDITQRFGVGQTGKFGGSFNRIVGFGGLGNDTIIFNNVKTGGYLEGGVGNDTIEIRSTGAGVQSSTIYGGDDNDFLRGGSGDDNIDGGSGNDTIYGGSGNDELRGDSGADLIFGDGGDDNLYGGLGNDSLVGGSNTSINDGNDNIFGEEDDDLIIGDNAKFSEDGSVILISGAGNDILMGGSGNDTIYGQNGKNIIVGESGNDSLMGGNDSDVIIGGSFESITGEDNDIIFGQGGADQIFGDNADLTPDNTLVALDGSGNDLIYGGQGSDTIFGQGGIDTLYGNEDNDTIEGGTEGDFIYGGNDNDLISGNSGDDKIYGEAGIDTLYGNEDNDTIEGGTEGDFIYGGTGDDSLKGDSGDDYIRGDSGNDIIFGNLGRDEIYGDEGLDIIFGDNGQVTPEAITSTDTDGADDTIYGGDDRDIILGGAGSDVIQGDRGEDVILGDHGRMQRNTSGEVERITTIFEDNGGDDTIAGNEDADIILGGIGNDVLSGGDADDILLGDNGTVVRRDGTADANDIFSQSPTLGGRDTIYGGAGNDIIMGGSGGADTTGSGGDQLFGDAGNDIVVGDNARITRNSADVVERIATILPEFGGDDSLEGNEGDDTLIGGTGSDRITGNTGDDIALSDNGTVVRNDGSPEANDIFSTDASLGGSDQIDGGDGTDILVGGSAGDSLKGQAGQDVIVGDHAYIQRNTANVIERISSHFDAVGGNDLIEGNADADIVIGGFGDDQIWGGDADDILLGDNGVVVRNDGGADANDIFSQSPTLGGRDTIYGGAGNDIIIGGSGGADITGSGGDELFGEAGDDVAVGDNARITRNNADVVEQITTTDTKQGGDDAIAGAEGDDILIGGFGEDTITGAAGRDIALGDNGKLDYTLDGNLNTLDLVTTIAPCDGDRDTIDAGADNDLLLGGTGGDTIAAGSGNDLVFGDHGKVEGVIDLSALPLNQAQPPFTFTAIDTQITDCGGDEIIHGGDGDDIILGQQGDDQLFGDAGDDDLIGGHNVAGGADGNDAIDGGTGNDVVAGDNAKVNRQAQNLSPRMRVLKGAVIYDENGNPQVSAAAQPNPTGAAGRSIELLDHGVDTPAARFGHDQIAGGAGDDLIFGQLGNDTIQGDSAIAESVSTTDPSVEAATDGDDYIEGGGGDDLVFGNLGQDDIIGGSSNLFGNDTPQERPDGKDTIFGGAGTRIARNDPGDTTAEGHARDADTIVGDNGNIFRLVGTNGVNSGSFLKFTYDNYSNHLHIIPRAIELLDYVQGGSPNNLGSDDLIHGEAGDDTLHGMTGNDVVFGEGQDDDIIGGVGSDRLYGGTGEDGIIGDDGKILTSRNGQTETLYSITTPNQETAISLPGPFTGAVINLTGRLKKEVDLVAFDQGGNDVIYGGLGDDFLHGGAGDDAISGAEALAEFYNSNPVTNLNPLNYDPVTRKLAAYNANNPRQEINGFLLNFEATDAAGNKIDDGKDNIFGDLGNDWLVGGTLNDRLFGGLGDDVLNADDNHDTNGGKNNAPDAPEFADGDFAFGGGGLDVMIANTGNDRLFDWNGEFNTYVVPFSPFGSPTVVRAPSPHVFEFLLALGKASGADRSLTEPNGELGLVTQKDPQWQDQHGRPRDPQAGNLPTVQRDTQGSPEDDSAGKGYFQQKGVSNKISTPPGKAASQQVLAVQDATTADPFFSNILPSLNPSRARK